MKRYEKWKGEEQALRLVSFIDNNEGDFNQLAMELFEHHYQLIPLYRKICDREGRTPENVERWEEIPAVHTELFKMTSLTALPDDTVRTFTTSGTTGHGKGKSLFSSPGMEVMSHAIIGNAARYLFPDNPKVKWAMLTPPPALMPGLIIAQGMETIAKHFGLGEPEFMIGKDGFEGERLVAFLKEAETSGEPVCIAGGSFAFVNFIDTAMEKGMSFKLPAGSRCLDAGGFKGRSREVSRLGFKKMLAAFFNIPENHAVNLFGMTEMASQCYDNCLADEGAPLYKKPPPWVKARVVDGETFEPVPPEHKGLLTMFDLSNFDRLMHVQSDDVAVAKADGGFEVIGRAKGAQLRGCSLSLEDIKWNE